MRVLNFAASPDKPFWRRTPEGWLRCKARVLAERIMPYSREEIDLFNHPTPFVNMVVRREEMADPESLSSLEGVPLVAGEHQWLDSTNVKEFTVGNVAGSPRVEGPYLIADLLVTDPDTIRAITSNELGEISAAYTAETDFNEGVFDGKKYDAVQRQLVFNHIAIIPAGHGRAGADVRILNTKGKRTMATNNFENGRKKALAEIEARLQQHYGDYEEDGGTMEFTNSRPGSASEKLRLTDPHTAGQQALRQVLSNSSRGIMAQTPTDVRRMFNASRQASREFARSVKTNRTVAMAKLGYLNANEAMQVIEQMQAEDRLRQLRRGDRHTPGAYEALSQKWQSSRHSRVRNRAEALRDLGFKVDENE